MNIKELPLKRLYKATLFPKGYRCLLCDKEKETDAEGFCEDCRKELEAPAPRKLPLIAGEINCSYLYDGGARKAMHRFKYQKQAWLARVFARNITLEEPARFDCIVPVPMHPLKQYLRSYNPAERIARAVSEKSGVPVENLLVRTKYAVSQTKKNRAERQLPPELYRAKDGAAGKTILLADDVITTGATLSACAAALLSKGAANVYAVCGCSAELEENK